MFVVYNISGASIPCYYCNIDHCTEVDPGGSGMTECVDIVVEIEPGIYSPRGCLLGEVECAYI